MSNRESDGVCFHMTWQGTWDLLEGKRRLGIVFLDYLAAGFVSGCMYSSLDIIIQQNSFGLRSYNSFHWLQINSEILIEQTDQRRSWKWFLFLKDGSLYSCRFHSGFLLPAAVSAVDSSISKASIIQELKKKC